MIYFIICYILSVGFYLLMHNYAKRYNIRQTEREEGLASHKIKDGTFTMGGVVFSLIPIFLFLISKRFTGYSLLISFSMLGYFILGLMDDLKVIKYKNNNGLSPKVRLIIEFILGFIIAVWLSIIGNDSVIGFGNFKINFGVFYCLLMSFYLTGLVNSFNLTDGIDSLLSSLCIIISLGLLIVCFKDGNYDVAFFLILLVISLASFYVLNYHIASIFMGNTGSLVLGGVLGAISMILNVEGLFLIMCIPLIFETVSDIIQVMYFKITKGKRFFKMAPFHHHLELLGYSERLISALFSLVEIIFVFIALIIGGYL